MPGYEMRHPVEEGYRVVGAKLRNELLVLHLQKF